MRTNMFAVGGRRKPFIPLGLVNAGFSPNDISGLELWMDGDSGYTDLSDAAHSIGGTNSAIDSNAQNGHDALSYAGSAYNSLTSPITDPNDLYIVTVAKTNDTSEGHLLSHRSESTRLIQCSIQNTISKLVTRSSGNSITTLSHATVNSDFEIRTYDFSNTAQEVITAAGSSSASVNYGTQTFNSTIWTIGGYNAGGGYVPTLDGQLLFLVVYSTKPTAGEIVSLNTYLTDRYAL